MPLIDILAPDPRIKKTSVATDKVKAVSGNGLAEWWGLRISDVDFGRAAGL